MLKKFVLYNGRGCAVKQNTATSAVRRKLNTTTKKKQCIKPPRIPSPTPPPLPTSLNCSASSCIKKAPQQATNFEVDIDATCQPQAPVDCKCNCAHMEAFMKSVVYRMGKLEAMIKEFQHSQPLPVDAPWRQSCRAVVDQSSCAPRL